MLDYGPMPYPKRASATPNVIKLVLDFDTLDMLKALAAERKIDTTRCAYELVQEALGGRRLMTISSEPAAAPDDPFAHSMQRGLAAISNRPKGNA